LLWIIRLKMERGNPSYTIKREGRDGGSKRVGVCNTNNP